MTCGVLISATSCAAETIVQIFRTEVFCRNNYSTKFSPRVASQKQAISEPYLFLRHSSVQKLGPIFVPAAQLCAEIVSRIVSAAQLGAEMWTCICFFSTPWCRNFELFVSSALLDAEITTPQVIVLMGLSI